MSGKAQPLQLSADREARSLMQMGEVIPVTRRDPRIRHRNGEGFGQDLIQPQKVAGPREDPAWKLPLPAVLQVIQVVARRDELTMGPLLHREQDLAPAPEIAAGPSTDVKAGDGDVVTFQGQEPVDEPVDFESATGVPLEGNVAERWKALERDWPVPTRLLATCDRARSSAQVPDKGGGLRLARGDFGHVDIVGAPQRGQYIQQQLIYAGQVAGSDRDRRAASELAAGVDEGQHSRALAPQTFGYDDRLAMVVDRPRRRGGILASYLRSPGYIHFRHSSCHPF